MVFNEHVVRTRGCLLKVKLGTVVPFLRLRSVLHDLVNRHRTSKLFIKCFVTF